MECPLCDPQNVDVQRMYPPAVLCGHHRRQIAASAAAAHLLSQPVRPEPAEAGLPSSATQLARAMEAAARDQAAESNARESRQQDLQQRARDAAEAIRPSAARLATALADRGVPPDIRVDVHEREQVQRRFGKPKWTSSIRTAAHGWVFCERFHESTDPDTWPPRVTRRLDGYVLDRSGALAAVHTDRVDGNAGGPYVITVGFASDWDGDNTVQGPLADHVLGLYRERIVGGLADLALKYGISPGQVA